MAGNNENDDDEFPLYDPFDEDGPFSEAALRNLISDQNPNLMDFTTEPNPPPPLLLPPPPPPPPTSVTDTTVTQMLQDTSLTIPSSDANNEFLNDDYTLSWDKLFESLSDDFYDDNALVETGNSTDVVVGNEGNNRIEPSNRVFGGENGNNFEAGGSSAPPVHVTPTTSEGIILCNCCNLLRQIVHTNGPERMRLEIRGGIGYFCHAILEIERLGEIIERRYQTFHLRGLDIEGVKAFFERYCLDREFTGWTLTQDTDVSFYESVNTGTIQKPLYVLNTIPPRNNNLPMSLDLPNQTLNVPSREESRPMKERRLQTPLAIQRERLRNMTLKDVGEYFSLSLDEASKKIGVCPTVVKRICRKGGLLRWPHRKIKSLQRKIEGLKSVLRTARDPGIRAKTEAEIEKLEKEISEMCSEILKNFK